MDMTLYDNIQNKAMSRYQTTSILLCVAINMLDGFDVLAMAFTASSVASEWQLGSVELGVLLSAGLFGMAAGSLLIAPLADKFGRRSIVLVCMTIISIGMLLSSFSQSMMQLTLMRAITGIGIGGMLASLNIIVAEYSSLKHRSFFVSFLQTGYPIGAIVGGVIAAVLISQYGWRSVFLFGSIVSFAMIPLVIWHLPESLDFLLSKRSPDALGKINTLLQKMGHSTIDKLPEQGPQDTTEKSTFLQLFSSQFMRSTLLIWTAFFTVMFSFYFVLSWAPKLMVTAGFSAEQGISAGVLINVGGVLGGLIFGFLSTKWRLKNLLACYMVATVIFMLIFGAYSQIMAAALGLGFLVGIFLFGSMIGLYALVPGQYPTSIRTTGMGFAIGIGRIGAIISPLIAGVLLDNQWQTSTLFYVFAAPLIISMIAVSFIKDSVVIES